MYLFKENNQRILKNSTQKVANVDSLKTCYIISSDKDGICPPLSEFLLTGRVHRPPTGPETPSK